ncbi:hypothetical protein GLAREA_02781 [Glarea lozoyensis ATCC 20868]|uniref:Uncharacterized protein n=1 Tax=Glarea lozoyensis (strain ATCC 20868 / MF5171) TaxID=1116229 RepID=S3CK40_GLAL2|nr:uncharacterized protein GLAREA_02781 [Glarea lozoyensis ATCC 20868]EPE26867.1 hypothetical protein GLAREA_02781 [Glarea lozoyensis ATCC 20868]
MAQAIQLLDERIMAYRAWRMKSQNHHRLERAFWSLFSLDSSVLDLDRLVVFCAGTRAKYMFGRRQTLEHFQSLPASTTAVQVCDKCDEAKVWANVVGGDDAGQRAPEDVSRTPWKTPDFGITYRYRQHSQESLLQLHSTVGSGKPIVCPHYPSSSLGSSDRSPNTSYESSRNSPNTSPREMGHYLASSPAVSPPNRNKTPLKSCLKKQIATKPEKVEPYDDTIFYRLAITRIESDHPTFGPNRLNLVVMSPDSPDSPHTHNGRPIISWAQAPELPKDPPRIFPPRHKRVRFDSRTSLPHTKIPELTWQPTARLPKIPKPPEGSVLPYIATVSYSQNWNFSQFIVTTTDPSDPGVCWLQQNNMAGQAILRPDMLNVCHTRPNSAKMRAAMASPYLTKRQKDAIRANLVKKTVQRIPPLRTKQSTPEQPISKSYVGDINQACASTLTRKSNGETVSTAAALAPGIRRAKNWQKSIEAFDKLEEIASPTKEPDERTISRTTGRSNNRRRNIRSSSKPYQLSHTKRSSDGYRLTEKERASQAAGAVHINPPEPARKKIGQPSPMDGQNKDTHIVGQEEDTHIGEQKEFTNMSENTESMDTAVGGKTESMNTVDIPFARSPSSFKPSSISLLSRTVRESRMRAPVLNSTGKDCTSVSFALPPIDENCATLVNRTSSSVGSGQSNCGSSSNARNTLVSSESPEPISSLEDNTTDEHRPLEKAGNAVFTVSKTCTIFDSGDDDSSNEWDPSWLLEKSS